MSRWRTDTITSTHTQHNSNVSQSSNDVDAGRQAGMCTTQSVQVGADGVMKGTHTRTDTRERTTTKQSLTMGKEETTEQR